MKKYFNKNYLIEFSGALFILFFIGLVSYCLFLKSTLDQYHITKQNENAQRIALQQKKYAATEDSQTIKALSIWQKKYPDFYKAMQSSITLDQLLQQVTEAAQQSGFSITQAQPIVTHKNKHKIQLVLSGSYPEIFRFIHLLSQSAWPIALEKLSIPQAGQFHLQLRVDIK